MIPFGVCTARLLPVDDVVGSSCISTCLKGPISHSEFKVSHNLAEVVVAAFEEPEAFPGKVCTCCEGIDSITTIHGNIIYPRSDAVECSVWEGAGSAEATDSCLSTLPDKEVTPVLAWKIGKATAAYEDKAPLGPGVETVV